MPSNCMMFWCWRMKIPASLATGEVPVVNNNVWPVLFGIELYTKPAHTTPAPFSTMEKKRNTKSSFPTGQNSFHSNRPINIQRKRNQYKHRKKKKRNKTPDVQHSPDLHSTPEQLFVDASDTKTRPNVPQAV